MTTQQPQLIESICLRDGKIDLLPYHQDRVDRSRKNVLGIKKRLHLNDFLATQNLPTKGYYKLRMVYDESIRHFSCNEYAPRRVHSLQVVCPLAIDYRYKYLARKPLDSAFSKRGECDDIIISQSGYLTDTYYGNLALYDNHKWWTPAYPLLRGVRRASLIETGRLRPAVIRIRDLLQFKEIRIINAMVPLEESFPIAVENVVLPKQK